MTKCSDWSLITKLPNHFDWSFWITSLCLLSSIQANTRLERLEKLNWNARIAQKHALDLSFLTYVENIKGPFHMIGIHSINLWLYHCDQQSILYRKQNFFEYNQKVQFSQICVIVKTNPWNLKLELRCFQD